MRRCRRFAGLEVAELAEQMGVSRTTVSHWENGHREPRRRDLMAYQLLTGFRWEWLETGGGEPFAAVSGRMRSRAQLRLAA